MLLILLVFLMKFVDISILNRARSKGPNVAATSTSNNNNSNSSSGNSSASSSNSSSKENFSFENNTSNQHGGVCPITPQQLQQLRHYQQLQQQQLLLLQRELLRRQKTRQQQHQQHGILKYQNQCNNNNNNVQQNNATLPHQVEARSYSNGGTSKGPKPRRGMTEFSTANENQKSHLPQLNHNSSHHHNNHNNHLQNHHHQTKPLTLSTTPHSPNHQPYHHQQQQQQQQTQQQQQQHNNHYKRPLTSPNNSPFNNYYGHGFPPHPHHNPASHHNTLHHPFGLSSANPYLNDLLINDDELTDECLKKNVQIVLNNLDRYNNALRSIILNEQVNGGGISNHSSFNNNLSSISNMAGNMVTTPESDYNSNATTPHHHFNHLVGLTSGVVGGSVGGGIIGAGVNGGGGVTNHGGGPLNCSIASSHDFTHDNSDYQWFLDYGYRDGVTHQSVLSSLSASYNGIGELSYYDDLAKNIDANLAEVDMESFRAEDIHSLLSHIPSYQHHNKDDDKIENSICKSELLFSPVKESHISIDSLDLDAYPDDGDIILTCKANKDNYTIAFEGSALYSDESFYEPNEIQMKNKQNFINLHSNLDDILKRKSLEVSMSRSDHAFTTWSKLKKSSTSQLQRYPSGNNNTSVNIVMRHAPHCTVRKSLSLPNLRLKKGASQQQLNVSQALSTSTVESCKSRNLLPMCQMPISQTSMGSPIHFSSNHSHHHHHHHHHHNDSSSHIDSTTSGGMNSSSATNNIQTLKQTNANQPAFNLVKLFIKQKSSCSSETTCMDVSSGCWPSSEGSSSLEQRIRKKSMNDSGKGSALSRHDEEEDPADSSYQLDSLDIICDKERNETTAAATTTTPVRKVKHDLYREVFETGAAAGAAAAAAATASPEHKKLQPLKNPQVINLTNNQHNNQLNNNNNNSVSEGSRTSENLTQVYNDQRSQRMKISAEMITRSMQTSARDRLKFVPPSFLAKLNNLGEEKQAPIYVIYPNYALPDLGFVKTNTAEVIFTPFNYKNAVGVKKRTSTGSMSEDELLKNVDLKHVVDWKSLATLLPTEYRKRLKHIPEVDVADLEAECSMKPLFCMSPPIRRTNNRANVCDCAQYFQTTTMAEEPAAEGAATRAAACESSSGSSHPPSSGYRGSSTLLSDSVFDNPRKAEDSDPLKNMYVYQYENQRMEEERCSTRHNRGNSCKNSNRLTSGLRNKRTSLIEEQSNSNVRNNIEKRRSLQEPAAYFSSNDDLQNPLAGKHLAEIDEYYDELHSNLKLTQGSHRLSRKDMDARTRAENFLASVPKSELKYYAEIANFLESVEENHHPAEHYDAAELKKEVSRALSQKKVSFNQKTECNTLGLNAQRFTTPPNSPNISIALRLNNAGGMPPHRNSRKEQEPNKISTNRFRRLQIQWELLSKDSSMMLKDLAYEQETKSGGSTPTSANAAHKSRIPRPVSYPAGKNTIANASPHTPLSNLKNRVIQETKSLRSPSRIVPPKRYSLPAAAATAPPAAAAHHPHGAAATASAGTTTTTTANATATPPVPAPRTRTPCSNRTGGNASNSGNHSNATTPKRRVQSPRTVSRTR
ncbi:uncharacterized protein LOC129916464 isoform X2 [Episyrphus balteatus]|uniref:uncharacterized protein LOC129916464 isoform X2 n=1 Tax=Episyrphus balteatus TaxID=286459 RepID=UPI002485EAAD|nr:uncharacterized protein LOC129916464 isoform X2 [Episyrphus balteatus]